MDWGFILTGMVDFGLFGILHIATFEVLFSGDTIRKRGIFMNENKTFRICITAVFIALVYIATSLIQIPIPLGYANLGDSIILLAAFLFSPWIACIAGGVGASMADVLTGYPIWAVPTLIIKAGIAAIAWGIFSFGNKGRRLYSGRTILGSVVSMIFMVAGYTVFGAVLYGSMAAGLSSTPGLLAEGLINIIVFYVIGTILEKAGIRKLVGNMDKGV